MNAVTTAEYAVLESMKPGELQRLINEHAAQGFKLIHYCATDYDGLDFTAVMVREPKTPLIYRTEAQYEQIIEAQRDITKLTARIAELEQRVTDMRNDVEKRLEDIEAKIDWSK